MGKIRIALSAYWFPFCIASYFRHALEKRPDVELFVLGCYTGDQIPWGGGMRLPMRYVKSVDLPLPASVNRPTWGMVKDALPWKPDLSLNISSNFSFLDKPDCLSAVVAVDPHVLNYDKERETCDVFLNMQRAYMKDGDIHLPYACSPDHHYAMSDVVRDYDASLIGLHYAQRDELVQALRNKGRKVIYDLGLVYDEYREQNNRAIVGLNWSSLQDINARTFEIMAMCQVPVINRLPHLSELGLFEDRHYLGFDTVQEGVSKVEWALANPNNANAIANCAYDYVHRNHTYELRVEQILKETGLL